MDIDADIHFQRRAWAAQRIGWFFFGVLIIAALLGFFGGGSMSRASGEASGLKMEYERFARFQQPTKLRLMFSADGDAAEIEISRRYLDAVHIEQITPAPSVVESADDFLIYRFAGRGHLVDVTFRLKPEKFGSLAGTAKISGGNSVQISQFIYP